jgi:hypothetical protein
VASSPSPHIVAFAGRRIDPPAQSPPRFPAENESLVRDRVRQSLADLRPAALVASAACGADLLALEVADELGVEIVVVLPWDPARFRTRSVVDRGRNWGERFDDIIDKVEARGTLRVLKLPKNGDQAYQETTRAILDVADQLVRESAEPHSIVAVAAWDGQSRGPGDLTERFLREARARHLEVVEISTR